MEQTIIRINSYKKRRKPQLNVVEVEVLGDPERDQNELRVDVVRGILITLEALSIPVETIPYLNFLIKKRTTLR